MKKLLCAAASICIASPKPRRPGGGFVFSTILGLGAGAAVGSAVARPYPYAAYPYGYYPYAVP